MLEVFANTPENMGPEAIGAYARRVEGLGYQGLNVPDAVHDGLLLACQALASTSSLKVATSVLVAFPRSPMNVAIAAWDLQRMSAGRFELGLGTQIRQNIEGRYSTRWLPPAAGMREYIGSLRAIFHTFRTGAPLDYVGEHYKFTRMQPFFNPGPIDPPDVPLALGAVGPKMLALVGECADGMHTHPSNTSPRYLREVIVPAVAEGARRRAPGLAKPSIAANLLVAMGPDDASVAKERERFRSMLAFLFSTPAYWPSLELFGWKAIGEKLLQMTRDKRWQSMAAVFDDQVLDEFLVSGRFDAIPDAVRDRYCGLVDRVAIPVPEDTGHDDLVRAMLASLRSCP
jgi:probable F420-dependent oxidoreductase